jgi:hypothetical protein
MSAESIEVYTGTLPFRVRSPQEGGGKELLVAREKLGKGTLRLDLTELGPGAELQVRRMPAVLGTTVEEADYQVLTVVDDEETAVKVRGKLLQQLAGKLG